MSDGWVNTDDEPFIAVRPAKINPITIIHDADAEHGIEAGVTQLVMFHLIDNDDHPLPLMVMTLDMVDVMIQGLANILDKLGHVPIDVDWVEGICDEHD